MEEYERGSNLEEVGCVWVGGRVGWWGEGGYAG